MHLLQVAIGALALLAPFVVATVNATVAINGVYICPEPKFGSGTKVKSDVYIWQATSNAALTTPT
jgi:hypothetical protein